MNTDIALLEEEFDRAAKRISDDSFIYRRGQANEVSLFIWCYDEKNELQIRELTDRFVKRSDLKCELVKRSLWDAFIAICENKKILDRIPTVEKSKGIEFLIKQLKTVATPEEYIKAMNWDNHQPGQVLLITDIGKTYPLIRAHALLEMLQIYFDDIPVILQYPGTYNGQELSLFGMHDANYYRAFELL